MKSIALAVCIVLVPVPGFSQAPPPPFAVKQFNDGAYWIVLESFAYQIGQTKMRVEVPKGFVTDFASIPEDFRREFGPTGKYARAAVIHDYLYWTQGCSKEQADKLLLLAMTESDVPYVIRRSIYLAVRIAGEPAWRLNQTERKTGLPRIIPEASLNIGSLDVWSKYQQQLYDKGVRPEPSITQPPAYCAADERDLY